MEGWGFEKLENFGRGVGWRGGGLEGEWVGRGWGDYGILGRARKIGGVWG